MPESRFEWQLFGSEQGAFKGTGSRTRGLLEAAGDGTLYLDDISEIGPGAQTKLLHLLDDGRFHRVGAQAISIADVRIIAGSNRDLVSAVREGRFREDLFYRLKVVDIDLPPLRERQDEIPRFIDHFYRKFARQHAKPGRILDSDTRRLLEAHPWPGNVRELSNALERFVLRGSLPTIAAAGGISPSPVVPEADEK